MVAEGRKIVYNTGFVLSICALISLLLAFVSPYWVQSWPRVHSGFKRVGMWEACFAGLVIQRDPSQKAYHGCWWILAKEYWYIRAWLMPWWFMICQMAITLVFTAEIICCIMLLYVWCTTGSRKKHGVGKKRAPLKCTQTAAAITVITATVMSGIVILFGVAAYVDHAWMPRRDLNYLSWSYAMAVLSAFFSIFAAIAQVIYVRIIRQDWREAPTPLARGSTPLAAAYFSSSRDTKV